MSLSFEELADAGLSEDAAPLPPIGRSKIWLFLVLLCLVCAASGAYFYHSEPELPEAAQILLSVDAEVPGVLPHALDDATEFEESFEYLKEGESAPDYRVSDEVEDDLPAASEVAEATVSSLIVKGSIPIAAELAELDEADLVLDRAPPIVLKQAIPQDVEIVFERDWGGVVLVPDLMKLAKAYTSDVRLDRIEAHPIDGEHLRVWARIQNVTTDAMNAEIGCEFRFAQNGSGGRAQFESIRIPPGGFVEKQFVSPQDRVASYTLMVKRRY